MFYLYKGFDLAFSPLRAFVVNSLLILKNNINHEALRFTKNNKENQNIKNIFLKKYNI